MAEAEKKPAQRQSRAPHLKVAKEVNVHVSKEGVFTFAATLTTTIDSWGSVPVGRICVPDGYALLINGTEQGVRKHLIVPEQIVTGGVYLNIYCTNASPELRRIYEGEAVAKGVLIKITNKVVIDELEKESK